MSKDRIVHRGIERVLSALALLEAAIESSSREDLAISFEDVARAASSVARELREGEVRFLSRKIEEGVRQ